MLPYQTFSLIFGPSLRRKRPWHWATGAILCLAACSGDKTTFSGFDESTSESSAQPETNESSSGTEAVETAVEANATESNSGPLYLVYTTIDTPDGRTGYYVTTPSIEEDATVNVQTGLEEPGGGMLFAPPEGGYVIIGSGESPTFTRYELGENDNLIKGATVSFANVGVESTWSVMVFVNPTKAYFLDRDQLRLISFNPSTMELIGALPIADFACEEVSTQFGDPVVRDDGVYFTRACWDLEITSAGSTLVHVDPKTDTITVTQDERCMGMSVGFLADSGDAYWFSDADASMEWSVQNRDAPHDCSLRVKAGEKTFDKSWDLDLTTRSGGVSAIGAVPGPGASVWVKVFDEDAMTEEIPVDEIDWGLSVWRWGLLDLEGNTPVAVDMDADLVVSYGDPIMVDGRAFSPASNSDYSETTLVELTDRGIANRLHVQGELRRVMRLR